jgi:predicted lipoprotein with Yx(FWY)xxD motif
MRRLLLAATLAVVLVPPAAAAAAAATVKVHKSRYGRILVDGQGRTLYLFTRDRGGKNRCYGACAQAWPPFLAGADAAPQAASGADAAKLGTAARRGGTTQVSYAGHPLYYYVNDRKPGQILCQDVAEFGGTWLVVTPAGRAVR